MSRIAQYEPDHKGEYKTPTHTLAYDFYKPHVAAQDKQEKSPIIFIAPGLGMDIKNPYVTGLAHTLSNKGFSVCAINYAAVTFHDQFTGVTSLDTKHLTPSVYAQTIHCAISTIFKEHKNLDEDGIGLVGQSIGSLGASWYTAHMNGLEHRVLPDEKNSPVYKVKGLALHAPVPNPLDKFQDKITFIKKLAWRLKGHVKHNFGGSLIELPYAIYKECTNISFTNDIATHIECPVYIASGEKDQMARPEDVAAFADHLHTPPEQVVREFIPNCGHMMENSKKMMPWLIDMKRKHYTDDQIEQMAWPHIFNNIEDITFAPQIAQHTCEFFENIFDNVLHPQSVTFARSPAPVVA